MPSQLSAGDSSFQTHISSSPAEQAKFPAEIKLNNSVICMSYKLLYHNANVKPVMIGKKRSIILHDVMLLKVRRTGCAMNPAGKKKSSGAVVSESTKRRPA